jgi:hypothetical protein
MGFNSGLKGLIWYRPMCVSVCIYVCMYVYIYIYIYVRAHMCRRVCISSFIRKLANVIDCAIFVSGFESWYSLPKDNAVQ